MLKSDLERLFRVEFFTIVFAIIFAFILLPFIPALAGLVGIIIVVLIGITIIAIFPELIIAVVGFIAVCAVGGILLNILDSLKFSWKKKVKEKRKFYETDDFKNSPFDQQRKIKRSYLDEKEVKKLIEKNKREREKKESELKEQRFLGGQRVLEKLDLLSKKNGTQEEKSHSSVGVNLHNAFLKTQNEIKKAEEEKIKKEEEEKLKLAKLKKERLLIVNNVKAIQKEIEKNEKTHTYDGKIDLAKWPLIKDRINFKYEEESITINFYGHYPNMEIKFPFDSKFFEVHIKLKTSDLGTYSKERFEYINDVNNFVVEKIGALWAKYKKDITSQ